MNYAIEKAFQKDFRNLKNKNLANDIIEAINNVQKANSISEIKNIKKLTGYKSAYRIRCGTYRIGITIEDNIITFVAFDHRKDIYKKFP